MLSSFLVICFVDRFVVLLGLLDLLAETSTLLGVAFNVGNAAKDVVGSIKGEQGSHSGGYGQPAAELELCVGPQPEGEQEGESEDYLLPPFHTSNININTNYDI